MAENVSDRCRVPRARQPVAQRRPALAARGIDRGSRPSGDSGWAGELCGTALAGGSWGARGVGSILHTLALLLLTASVTLNLGCKDESTTTTDAGSKKPDLFITPDADQPDPFALVFQELDLPGSTEGITNLHFIPGRSEFIVLEKNGRILHYQLDADNVSLLGTQTLRDVYSGSDCGLVSAAFDPDFEDNGFVYFGYCDSDSFSTISRHEFPLTDINSTRAEIIRVGIANAPEAWHNVGSIGFDPDGTMWALFGEKKVDDEAQNTDSNLGSLLRIVPNRDPSGEGYQPAPDNPFADGTGSPDIWAYGLRSPWKGFRDSLGRYWVGDVGAATWEELDVITGPGENLGWPRCEGFCEGDADGLTAPITAWNRSSESDYALEDLETEPTDRRVVWAGLEYQPTSTDRYDGNLTGRVLFGDFCAGWVRALSLDDEGRVTFDQNIGHLTGVTGIAQGPDDYVYFVTYGNCKTFPLREGRLWRAKLADP